ncbi:MAG: M23 family metallopeptidase [Acidobacteria bacterium]|nr:M23 family metallopeptidase [Acidobacteriota bacterium]
MFRVGLRTLAASLACVVALTVLAAPSMAQPAAAADQPQASSARQEEKAAKTMPLQRRLFEQAALKTQRDRVSSAISAIGAGDSRIKKLLAQVLAKSPTTPAASAQPRVLGNSAKERPANSQRKARLKVPVYAAPLFLQLSAIDRALDDVTAKIESRNRGDEFGLGIAAFPVRSGYEFEDSWGFVRSGGRSHKGNDILSPRGTAIIAIEDGVIERHSSHHLGGLAIYFRGDSGALYYYAHLDSFGPQAEGERVAVGDVIGANGDTGNASGTPHLHFQYSPNGDDYGWIDPYPLLVELSQQGWDPGRAAPPPIG